MKEYSTVLTIAGSDSGGGAGIQADIKTMTSLGCFAACAITSLTAQNTTGVQAIAPVSAEFLSQQLSCVLEDISINCIKIGMLHNENIINTVYHHLVKYNHIPIVLDPVMVATSEDPLLEKRAIDALIRKIFPIATLITPNIYEAKTLIKSPIDDLLKMEIACKKLKGLGASNILIKGGDLDSSESTDILLTANNKIQYFESPKIQTRNTHGTGCSLSSAIASFLSKGHNLVDSVSLAKIYITKAIESGSKYKIGNGRGPINHMWEIING